MEKLRKNSRILGKRIKLTNSLLKLIKLIKFRTARNTAGRGSDGGGVDGDMVGVSLLVRLGLNTHIPT